ncbi:MAG: competence protein ComEC, partial [Thiothrix nivea]
MRTFSLCFFGGTWLSLSFTSIDLLNAAGFSAAVLALCIIPILFSRRPSRRFLTAVFALCLGFAYAALYIQQHNQQQLPEALAGQNLLLSGVIRGLPEANDQGYQFLFQLESAILPAAEVDDADDDVIVPALSGLLRLSWYRHFPSQLNSGDRWQLLVRAKPPNGLMNPGSMDYEKWLFAQRIIATGYVRQSAQNQRLGPSRSGYIDRLRQQVQRAIQYHLEDWPEQGLVAALAVAARSDMNVAQWEVLRRTGTSHLMAISGLHIALVAGLGCLPVLVIWWLWPRLYLWLPVRMAAGLSGALAALAYALMAGLTLPTQRALVMVLVLLAGLLWRRNIPFTVVLCWALQAVLLLDPLAALSPGFWLSFAAVLMIFLLTRRDVRRRSKWSVIGIQFGLSLGMIPLTASWFGTVSLVSPLA